jgi:hypothetical protein
MLENPQIRQFLGMDPHMSGVLVTRTHPMNNVGKMLQKGDVLLELDGHTIGAWLWLHRSTACVCVVCSFRVCCLNWPLQNFVSLANDGTIHYRNRERILLSYLLCNKFRGDTVTFKVLRRDPITREVQMLQFDSTLDYKDPLVPVHQYDKVCGSLSLSLSLFFFWCQCIWHERSHRLLTGGLVSYPCWSCVCPAHVPISAYGQTEAWRWW